MAEVSEEKKTELRLLFEESIKRKQSGANDGGDPAGKFSLFSTIPLPEELVEEVQQEEQTSSAAKEWSVQGPSLMEIHELLDKELKRRWPEPVGAAFHRSSTEQDQRKDEALEETKQLLKDQSRKKMKAAIRKGLTRRPKPKPKAQ